MKFFFFRHWVFNLSKKSMLSISPFCSFQLADRYSSFSTLFSFFILLFVSDFVFFCFSFFDSVFFIFFLYSFCFFVFWVFRCFFITQFLQTFPYEFFFFFVFLSIFFPFYNFL